MAIGPGESCVRQALACRSSDDKLKFVGRCTTTRMFQSLLMVRRVFPASTNRAESPVLDLANRRKNERCLYAFFGIRMPGESAD